MACDGGGRSVDKHGVGITAEAFNHEVSGERVDVGKAGNIGGDVVGNRDAPGIVDAFVFLPRAGRANGQYALVERAGGDGRGQCGR